MLRIKISKSGLSCKSRLPSKTSSGKGAVAGVDDEPDQTIAAVVFSVDPFVRRAGKDCADLRLPQSDAPSRFFQHLVRPRNHVPNYTRFGPIMKQPQMNTDGLVSSALICVHSRLLFAVGCQPESDDALDELRE